MDSLTDYLLTRWGLVDMLFVGMVVAVVVLVIITLLEFLNGSVL